MKKLLLSMLVALMSLPAIAQKYLYQDGVVYKLFTPDDATPYVVVSGNEINSSTDLVIPYVVSEDGVDYPVTWIDDCAFLECIGLTSVYIPNSVSGIAEFAFLGCSRLTSVFIGGPVKVIAPACFADCYSLTLVNIPNTVNLIETLAFAGCRSLTSVTIPNSVKQILSEAFSECGLTTVNIPNSVKFIGERAFAECINLASVTIPNSVNKIDPEAFSMCGNLKEVNYNTTQPITADKSIFDSNTYQTATLNVAIGGLDNAKATVPWCYFSDIRELKTSVIDDIATDVELNGAPVEVLNLNGVRVADSTDNLPAGLYIVRQGNKTQKVAVK